MPRQRRIDRFLYAWDLNKSLVLVHDNYGDDDGFSTLKEQVMPRYMQDSAQLSLYLAHSCAVNYVFLRLPFVNEHSFIY